MKTIKSLLFLISYFQEFKWALCVKFHEYFVQEAKQFFRFANFHFKVDERMQLKHYKICTCLDILEIFSRFPLFDSSWLIEMSFTKIMQSHFAHISSQKSDEKLTMANGRFNAPKKKVSRFFVTGKKSISYSWNVPIKQQTE